MRYPHLIAAAALALCALQPTFALAQQAGTPMGDLLDLNRFATRGFMNQWSATRPTSLSGMSPSAEAWLRDQVQIQAQTPRPPHEVLAAVEETLGEAIHQAAKAERAKPQDVSRAIVLKIMLDTKSALAREARRVDDVTEPGWPAWSERIAQADANRREAMKLQSTASLALARD
jgi:hypothetical protein